MDPVGDRREDNYQQTRLSDRELKGLPSTLPPP
jgi:hypothetical protein